jgi:hypothetical protein
MGKEHCLRLIAVVALAIHSAGCFAQQNPPDSAAGNVPLPTLSPHLQSYVPPTPTAAALGKYVDMPVSLYTGTPEINIPLYEITSGDLKLPISLNYHAGGFRVEEQASWVGLGWSILAGGVVTRTVRHLEDGAQGARHAFFKDYTGGPLDPKSAFGYNNLHMLSAGVVDGSPDLYSYHFNGKSGKFIFIDGQAVLLPKQPLAIAPLTQESLIKITDEQGNIYTFSETEVSHSKSATSASSAISSWYLTSIVSPTQDRIDFEYVSTQFRQQTTLSETKHYAENTGQHLSLEKHLFQVQTTTLQGKELSKIKFSQGEVHFFSTTNREDIDDRSSAYPARRLEGIKVLDKQGTCIRKYGFMYDYFLSKPGAQHFNERRLKLISLVVDLYPNAGNGFQVDGPGYAFDYDETYKLPAKTSRAQDHWGYFNNRLQNTSLVPELEGNRIDQFKPNREPEQHAAKAYLLTKITYPTGGSTLLEYENHTYGFIGNKGQVLEQIRIPKATFSAHIAAWKQRKEYTPASTASEVSTDIFEVKKNTEAKVMANIDFPVFRSKGFVRVELRQYLGGQDMLLESFTNSAELEIPLTPGRYYLKAICTMAGGQAIGVISCVTDYEDKTRPGTGLAGGVRVKKITQRNGSLNALIHPDMIRTYDYTWNGDSATSSGVLIASPEYLSKYSVFVEAGGSNDKAWCLYDEKRGYSLHSESQHVLGNGGHIGYREVTVQSGLSGEQGKTVSLFTSAMEYPNWQGLATSELSWKRGLLLFKRDYQANGRLVAKLQNDYHFAAYKEYYGLQAELVGAHPCAQDTYNPDIASIFPKYYRQRPGLFVSEWQYLAKTRQVLYHAGDSTETTTEYVYDNLAHLQPTRIITLTSDGKRRINYAFYPADFAESTGFIADLKAAHIQSIPIELVTYEEEPDGLNPRIISGQVHTYKPGGKGLQDEIWKLETGKPIHLSQFKFAHTLTGHLPNAHSLQPFRQDSRYKRTTSFNAYDDTFNPIQITEENDTPVSYMWGYNREFPIAKVVNARAEQIFHTSFETDGTADSLAKAGRKVWVGNFTIPPSQRPVAGQYQLSYWERMEGQWQYRQQIIDYSPADVPLIITVNFIDEVRLHPVGSRMTTYTYDLLLGMTSATDANNITSYYYYDATGRLHLEKDLKGNVRRRYEYRYANQ